MKKEVVKEGQIFLQVCRNTRDLFDEWLNTVEEADMKIYFKKFVQSRNYLNHAIEKVEEVLDLESKK